MTMIGIVTFVTVLIHFTNSIWKEKRNKNAENNSWKRSTGSKWGDFTKFFVNQIFNQQCFNNSNAKMIKIVMENGNCNELIFSALIIAINEKKSHQNRCRMSGVNSNSLNSRKILVCAIFCFQGNITKIHSHDSQTKNCNNTST